MEGRLKEMKVRMETVVKERDLKEMEIKSFANILKQKDSLIREKETDRVNSVEIVKDLENTVRKVKIDRENLIDDNSRLVKKNEQLQSEIQQMANKFSIQKEDQMRMEMDYKREIENQKQREMEYQMQREMDLHRPREYERHSEREELQTPYIKVFGSSSDSKDFHNASTKTAKFMYSEEKENSSMNSLRGQMVEANVPLPGSIGRIGKNRSLSTNR